MATLGFELGGEGVLETCCEGASSWANASRGWLKTGVFATTWDGGGTMVGKLVWLLGTLAAFCGVPVAMATRVGAGTRVVVAAARVGATLGP